MVFSGRPSDACYPCRKGRLRCDRIQPGCTQCSRKNITCPGYRDLSDFLFRDETANAALKVQNRKPRRRHEAKVRPQPSADASSSQLKLPQRQHAEAVASTSAAAAAAKAAGAASHAARKLNTAFRSPADPSSEVDVSVVRYRNVSTPIEDLARTYFMVEYIASSPFEYLPKLYPHGLNEQNAMSAAIMAASFASLALKCSDGNLMKQARMHYAKALCQTNKCLSSTDLAVQDSTLAAVLLLGLFEAIVFTGQQSLDSWNAHTVGAVELLRLRGPKQLETPLGRTLFLHSSGNIRTSCAHTKRAVPPRLLQLFESAKPMLDLSDPFLMTAPIVDRVASLRSRIERVHDQNRRDLVWEALDLDIETLRLGQGVAEDWKFTARLPGQSSRLTYKGISLRYPSLRALRYWNALRIIRMFLNDLVWVQSSKILQQGPDLDDETDYEELQTSAKRNMSTLVVEVLASCGEYLEPAEERFSVSARCLIWPLSVIAEVSITPPDARQFATDCLERLGRDCRIPKAADMTTSLLSIQGADWYVPI